MDVTHSAHSKRTVKLAKMAFAKGFCVTGLGFGVVGVKLGGQSSGKRRLETNFLVISSRHGRVSPQGRKLSPLYSV